MTLHRRSLLALPLLALARPALAADRADVAREVLLMWHKLMLELVRHTATYTPPVPSVISASPRMRRWPRAILPFSAWPGR
jgi:hypothetical protein